MLTGQTQIGRDLLQSPILNALQTSEYLTEGLLQ
jgi:hypothetical protein